MSNMTRQNYHHGDLKSDLIRKGLTLLSQEGYEAFSLRKVAAACGVSQTAPYRHFKDKDELIQAILDQAMSAFNESLEAAVHQYPDDPRSQLKEMGMAYIRFFADNPEYMRLLFLSDMKLTGTEAFPCGEDAHMQPGHAFATLFGAVHRYCEAYPDRGWDEQQLTLYCWGLVHGISVLLARGEFPCVGGYEPLVRSIIWNEHFL